MIQKMVRQRKLSNSDKPQKTKNKPKPSNSQGTLSNKMNIVQSIVTLIILCIACFIVYKGYLETRVNTPFDNQKVVQGSGLDVPDLYWGSYRPGTYFGLKTREPYSPVVGLMWYFPHRISSEGISIRHWCEASDGLSAYTWTKHDGRNFGIQEIVDSPVRITTSFVKQLGGQNGGDWTARVSVSDVESKSYGEPVSLLFYAAFETQTSGRVTHYPGSHITGIVGKTDQLGAFTIRLFNISGNVESDSHLTAEGRGLHLLKEVVISTLQLVTVKGVKQIVLPGDITRGKTGNFTVTQITVRVPFEMDIVYESASFVKKQEVLTGQTYNSLLQKKSLYFDNKFESVFKLREKGYNNNEIGFAQAAFSNLIGGIGYFFGSSRVRSEHTKDSVPYWKAPLYTSVPSRSFFPRGFLWDEGFHGLLLSMWDLDIEFEIMSHWFDLMNVEGWIPREQILGVEALAKVPDEFVVQVNTNANPPTFFLTLQFILQNRRDQLTENHLNSLARMYTRLVKWFKWYNTTQTGELAGTYRWRGRNGKTNLELNPKTLTSGFDDYPRASHPSTGERHIDLRCWIAIAAKTLSDICELLGMDGDKYAETYKFLSDNKLLDHLHYSYRSESYADFGLHTDSVMLVKPKPQPHQPHNNPQMHRVVMKDPELQFVDTTFGYVNLFPFLLQILEPHSLKLLKLLNDIRKPQLLWTEYGLRSLSKKSPLYMKFNTEHDPPYWRGPVWININYLALKALSYYSKTPGPHADKAKEIYMELRNNIIKNMLKEYKRTGYIWEQYNDKTGEGQGSRPFTGWSSLVVLIMAELY